MIKVICYLLSTLHYMYIVFLHIFLGTEKLNIVTFCVFLSEMVTVSSTPRQSNIDASLDIETETDYLKIAKKGGGHKGKGNSLCQIHKL